jgi:hypothetical protein
MLCYTQSCRDECFFCSPRNTEEALISSLLVKQLFTFHKDKGPLQKASALHCAAAAKQWESFLELVHQGVGVHYIDPYFGRPERSALEFALQKDIPLDILNSNSSLTCLSNYLQRFWSMC